LVGHNEQKREIVHSVHESTLAAERPPLEKVLRSAVLALVSHESVKSRPMTAQSIDRDALEAKWRANDAELNRIASAPPLDRIMLEKREEQLLDEQDQIEFELGRNSVTPFDPARIVSDYRSVIANLETDRTDLGKAEFQAVAQRLRNLWAEWQGEDSLHEMAFGEPEE
jgi:hypothetical protein